MLELLSLRKGTTLTKEMFLNHLYGGMDEPELKIIDVFICKLRKKLAQSTGGENYIETVWGRGYVLRDPNLSLRRTDRRERLTGFRPARGLAAQTGVRCLWALDLSQAGSYHFGVCIEEVPMRQGDAATDGIASCRSDRGSGAGGTGAPCSGDCAGQCRVSYRRRARNLRRRIRCAEGRNAEIEQLFPHLKRADSPSDVGRCAPSRRLCQGDARVRMLSLANAFDDDRHRTISTISIRRYLGLGDEAPLSYTAEPKIDGLSLSLAL